MNEEIKKHVKWVIKNCPDCKERDFIIKHLKRSYNLQTTCNKLMRNKTRALCLLENAFAKIESELTA